jgi:predicted DNA-binding transcriptional regulator AlpA
MASGKKPEGSRDGHATSESCLLKATDVSRITGLSTETLAQWRSQEKGMPFIRVSRNCIRYRQADLDKWIEERIVRPAQDPDERGRRC